MFASVRVTSPAAAGGVVVDAEDRAADGERVTVVEGGASILECAADRRAGAGAVDDAEQVLAPADGDGVQRDCEVRGTAERDRAVVARHDQLVVGRGAIQIDLVAGRAIKRDGPSIVTLPTPARPGARFPLRLSVPPLRPMAVPANDCVMSPPLVSCMSVAAAGDGRTDRDRAAVGVPDVDGPGGGDAVEFRVGQAEWAANRVARRAQVDTDIVGVLPQCDAAPA